MTRHMIPLAAATALAASAGLAQDGNPRMEEDAIVYDNVRAETPGYLVVSESVPEGATASEPLGFSEVQQGDNPEVRIEGAFDPTLTYLVTFYLETNEEEGYQWGEDVEIGAMPTLGDDMPVMTSFPMMVESGTEDSGDSDSDGSGDSDSDG